MRKIDLTPYFLDETEVNVKVSLSLILFNPALKLGARDSITQDALARKIEESNGSVLLEEAEYDKIVKATEAVTGYGRGDVPLLQRIFDAPEIKVKEVEDT